MIACLLAKTSASEGRGDECCNKCSMYKKLTILARSCSIFAFRSSIVMVSTELSSPFSGRGSGNCSESSAFVGGVTSLRCDVEVEDNSWADMVLIQVGCRNTSTQWLCVWFVDHYVRNLL